MGSLPEPGFTLPPFVSHSYPVGAANTAAYPRSLLELRGSGRHLFDRIESEKKAFTFDLRFVYYASFVAGA